MTLVKCYHLDTGHVDVIEAFDRTDDDPSNDPNAFLLTLLDSDKSANSVYYLESVE